MALTFMPSSQIVQTYVRLLVPDSTGVAKMTFDKVPNMGNLREVVRSVLTSQGVPVS